MSIIYIRDKNDNFVQIPSIPGKSAYEIAVAKGTFSGTEQEFAEMQVINNKEIIDQITQENIDPTGETVLDWVQPDSTNAYMKGDKVKHNEQIYVSIVDNNVWEPGVYGWELAKEE